MASDDRVVVVLGMTREEAEREQRLASNRVAGTTGSVMFYDALCAALARPEREVWRGGEYMDNPRGYRLVTERVVPNDSAYRPVLVVPLPEGKP